MKVLHITTSSKGGAGIAALRLHHALQASGVQSGYISKNLSIDFGGMQFEDAFFTYQKPSISTRVARKLNRLLFPTAFQGFKKKVQATKAESAAASIPYSGYDLLQHPMVQEADIIHLHWVAIIMDYPTFFRNINTPIVWTLHDMNPFMGLCHYENDAVNTQPGIAPLETEAKKIKQNAIATVEKGALISPSQWLLEKAIDSQVFEHFKIKKCIPNVMDMTTFKIQDPFPLRDAMGISKDAFVLLYISATLKDYRKGADLLLDALAQITFPATLLTVGKGTVQSANKNLKIVSLGHISSAKEMANAYAMANVFVLPSREDNLPNVMLESFACGTPVVSYPNGGMKEHIQDGVTGSIAKDVTAAELANTLTQFYNEKEHYDPEIIRNYALSNFTYEKGAKAYLEVYTAITN